MVCLNTLKLKIKRTPDEEWHKLEITGIQWVHSLVVRDNQLYIEELSCDAFKVNSVCEDCLSKSGASNKYIVRGTGRTSEERDDVSDLHDNDNDGQLYADNSKESKDKAEVEDRECVSADDFAWAKHGRI